MIETFTSQVKNVPIVTEKLKIRSNSFTAANLREHIAAIAR